MLYYNTKYRFALPPSAPELGGGIIAASAMMSDQLTRRDWRKYKYLAHRLFDPQLYLSGLDPLRGPAAVAKLATYPWFGVERESEYDSGKHRSLANYREAVERELTAAWTRQVPSPEHRFAAVVSALEFQLEMECEALILPSPLISSERDLDSWISWTDAGIEAARRLRISRPLLATIAISDILFPGTNPAKHSVLRTLTAHAKARSELGGAYVVPEIRHEDGYHIASVDTVSALLYLVSRLSASRRRLVVVNYVGAAGIPLMAAGASIWATGYYRSQRRLRLEDFYATGGSAYPRYASLHLFGDVGLEEDVDRLWKSSVFPFERWHSSAARPLFDALKAGRKVDAVAEWRYAPSNVTAANEHYLATMDRLGRYILSRSPLERVDLVSMWMRRAVECESRARASGAGTSTDTKHQRAWLTAFERWIAER